MSVPADKSIAHRSAIFAALADGVSRIGNYPRGEDTLSTLSCLRQLGVEIEWDGSDVTVVGRGLDGLSAPSEPLHCGNSGTTMRLLAGLLAGRPFDSVLVGDASLSRRPMERIARPLREMGGSIGLDDGYAPIRISGRSGLDPIDHTLAVASAQVKSSIILAGLSATGQTIIREPVPSRDHTERMLGLRSNLERGIRAIQVDPTQALPALDIDLPRDFSSAAFWLVAGTIVQDSEIHLPEVGVNPTRTGLLDVLRESGADIEMVDTSSPVEPVADLTVRSAELREIRVGGRMVPLLIDEIPILAVASTRALEGGSFTEIGELRAKESDRIAAVEEGLRAFGAETRSTDNSLRVESARALRAASVRSHSDHRIAMSMAVAALIAVGETTIQGAEVADVSYPTFWSDLEVLH